MGEARLAALDLTVLRSVADIQQYAIETHQKWSDIPAIRFRTDAALRFVRLIDHVSLVRDTANLRHLPWYRSSPSI